MSWVWKFDQSLNIDIYIMSFKNLVYYWILSCIILSHFEAEFEDVIYYWTYADCLLENIVINYILINVGEWCTIFHNSSIFETQLKKCCKMTYNITRSHFQTQLKKCCKMTYNINILHNQSNFETQLKKCYRLMYIITILCNICITSHIM